MKTPAKVVLLTFVSLLVVGAMIHLFSPHGLPALIDKLVPEGFLRAGPRTPAARPALAASPAATTASSEARLHEAESAYDSGDFSHALDLYEAANAEADTSQRDRVTRGLRRTVLAWALTTNVAMPNPLPDNLEADLARRKAAALASPSEKAWYDTTIFAAGIGASKELHFFAEQAIGCAVPRGPVEERLQRVLAWAGPRGSLLQEAMIAQGLLEPVDPVTAGTPPTRPAARPPAPVAAPPLQVPYGKFSEAMRKRLATAIDLERKGVAEYDLSGPDQPKRKEHRKAALDYLVQARDIYEAAQIEDSHSSSLDRRMHDVMEMISHLRKETNLGD